MIRENHLDSVWNHSDSSEPVRGPLFHKTVTGQVLFFATCYKNDSRFHQPASRLNIPAFAKFFAHQKDYIRLDYIWHISILSTGRMAEEGNVHKWRPILGQVGGGVQKSPPNIGHYRVKIVGTWFLVGRSKMAEKRPTIGRTVNLRSKF